LDAERRDRLRHFLEEKIRQKPRGKA